MQEYNRWCEYVEWNEEMANLCYNTDVNVCYSKKLIINVLLRLLPHVNERNPAMERDTGRPQLVDRKMECKSRPSYIWSSIRLAISTSEELFVENISNNRSIIITNSPKNGCLRGDAWHMTK